MIRQRALPALVWQGISGYAGTASSTPYLFQSKYFHCLAAAIAVLLFSSTVLHAATINYPDVVVPATGISFIDISESSGTDTVPLYGPPSPFLIGMGFKPKNFIATTNGGGSDITDGQLNFTVMGAVSSRGPGVGIDAISLFEGGDYTLAGIGTAATQVLAGAILSARITHIDGQLVPAINIPPVNGSVGFNLANNPGQVQPWSLGMGINVAAHVPPGALIGATKVEVVINNQLLAFSQLDSAAFIAKKDFRIDIIPTPGGEIPEPSTLMMVGFSLALMGCRAKQGRRMAA